jgi:hypothetical protein
MAIELLAMPIIAASAGLLLRKLGELIAQRTGHSPDDADRALGSAGFSLIAKPRNEDAAAHRARA